MLTTLCYEFDNVSIMLQAMPESLAYLINDYSCLKPSHCESNNHYVSISFTDNFPASKLLDNLPPGCLADAVAERKILLNGARIYKRYSSGQNDLWHVYEDFGAVHIDIQNSRIESYCCDAIAPDSMLQFLVLFINPLISALRKFGYQYLHAAACSVLGKNILFAGLSGRGKSTASLALAIKGHYVMTDESVLLRRENGQVYAVALMSSIKISRDVIKRFWPSFEKGSPIYRSEVAVKASELGMEPASAFNRIDCVCILSQSGIEETKIHSANALDVVPEVLPASVYAADKDNMERSFLFLTDFLKSMPCYKVFFGTDMNRFVHEIERLSCQLKNSS